MKYPMQCAKCFRVCRLSKSGKTWICTICKHREKANGGQAVSDTPRTDVLLIAHDMAPTHISLISHARELERELNRMADRINKLEEAGDKAILNSYLPDRISMWNKAKEAEL